MSQTTKLVLGIAIAVMVLGSGYAYWKNSAEKAESTSAEEVTTLPSGTDTSDPALDKDMSAIDTQIQAVGTDNTDVSTSVTAAQAK